MNKRSHTVIHPGKVIMQKSSVSKQVILDMTQHPIKTARHKWLEPLVPSNMIASLVCLGHDFFKVSRNIPLDSTYPLRIHGKWSIFPTMNGWVFMEYHLYSQARLVTYIVEGAKCTRCHILTTQLWCVATVVVFLRANPVVVCVNVCAMCLLQATTDSS